MISQIIEKLAVSTAGLARAARAGDWRAAEQALAARDEQLGLVLARAAELTPAQREELERIERQGAAAVRILVARRETVRAEIAALEAERRRLTAWAPQREDSGRRMDLEG